MRKAPKDLLDTTKLVTKYPELQGQLHGLEAIYGKIIFAWRLKAGLTQAELAKKANMDVQSIYRAEGGFVNLGTETYHKLFKVLK